MTGPIGVLVMAYGGPDRLADVEPYLMDVRGGRSTPPEVLQEVRHRYEQIGGRSPILERTRAQAAALQLALDALHPGFSTFVGMRHWHPYIREAVTEMAEGGIRKLVGLVMAPHFSRMSIGAYFQALGAAVEQTGTAIEVAPIESWKDDAGYLAALESRIRSALLEFAPDQRPLVHLILTAHSLPTRIETWNDPYPAELQATYQALTGRFPGQPAHFAYQSAAMTSEPWLEPDAGDLMDRLVEAGARNFLVVPIGFVSEHVEILYDIDIEMQRRAARAGARLRRIEMPGASEPMMESLAGQVLRAARERGWL